ncbi:L-type lectin-domain containing receptor kinase IX.1-like [Lolium rigidum]|uniref:L-type lectin-domain containing receptor kinase IX.1-like n=1 Tax=Lolium rigidum TaxID=89674 RepID=UPI001F5E0D0A|nr:L-type lectin-domain containing receptor kinase IX.1-like [Lolium rigidum]
MCYADRNATECLDCLAAAPERTVTLCRGSRNASANYDACLLHYSDTRFFASTDFTYGADDADEMIMSSSPNTTDVEAMSPVRSQLMEELMEKAGDRPERFYNYSLPYRDAVLGTDVISGLAQCTRDLAPSECNRCISGYYYPFVPTFFSNRTAGSIKGYSCYLRYQLGAIDITPPPAQATLALPPPPVPASTSSPTPGRLTIELYVGSASFIVIFFVIWLLVRRWKTQAKIHVDDMLSDDELALEDDFEKGTGPKRFRYKELSLATDNFSDDRKLGEGGFGSVYRGFLGESKLEVAIKRVSKGSKQGKKEYVSEVSIISRLRHRNLVQLIGWCHGGGELLLVYELMPNGSLDTHLYHSENILPWKVRYEVILGLGSALVYLHQEWEQCVLHRDIKPSNIMLDAPFNTKLGDFGLARLVNHGQGPYTTGLAGTMGYMDPECVVTGRTSVESDVYSFGVVLLEIACGRRPAVSREEAGDAIHLVQWVWDSWEGGRTLEVADVRLNKQFDDREMECVITVGLWCAHPDRNMRPSIKQAVSMLQFESPLPSLPLKMEINATFKPSFHTLVYASQLTGGR